MEELGKMTLQIFMDELAAVLDSGRLPKEVTQETSTMFRYTVKDGSVFYISVEQGLRTL